MNIHDTCVPIELSKSCKIDVNIKQFYVIFQHM